MKYLKLVRYQNLLMLALMQLLFRYGFIVNQNIPLALNDLQYCLLVLSTVMIAAAGYLINNVFDQETDRQNKPQDVIVGRSISEGTAYNIYVALNVIGVGSGFYLSNVINKPAFAAVFVIVAGTLYLYASSFKRSLLVGNIIIALLLSISIIIIGIFDLYPVLTPETQPLLKLLFQIVLDYAVFAFMINLIREIVKDLEDVNGDYNEGMNTLPIVLGVSRTARLVFFLTLIPVVLLLVYTYTDIFHLTFAALYAIIFIVTPLVYFMVKIWSAKTQRHFNHLSTILKLVMFLGILSIVVIQLNMNYNA
ncbi:MAG TPA: geranylgeranylglycerol-phosphate geranylgeranyltransferase [Flavobacterium sp.]|jgi:4-hydroxybenzoate polyprenyltransferase